MILRKALETKRKRKKVRENHAAGREKKQGL